MRSQSIILQGLYIKSDHERPCEVAAGSELSCRGRGSIPSARTSDARAGRSGDNHVTGDFVRDGK